MASLLRPLLERIGKVLSKLPQLSSQSQSTSSSPSTGNYQFEAEQKKLRERMERIRDTLDDAEEREIREYSVKAWVRHLRDVAYDADDVLDEVNYELLRHQLACEQEEHTPSTHKQRGIKRRHEVSDHSNITPTRCPLVHNPLFQQEILAKIKEINNRFDEIYEDGVKLKLHDLEDGPRRSELPTGRMPTSCLVEEQGVRGREDDKHKVREMLLCDDYGQCNENVCTVSIVGMGGVGKTTLAQVIYKDDEVVKHFHKRLWVCVSDTFEMLSLTKQILKEINPEGSSSSQSEGSLNSLQQSLHEKLQEKRFLLVLDDVWNENQGQWKALWVSLLGGAKGSRILITTRSEKVSRTSCVSEANMYQLGCLTFQESWSLFEKRAFGGSGSSQYPELVRMGKKIVRRCKGLPLAVKTLAGLLFGECREDLWEDLLRSELWELPEGKDEILPALRLSYHHLPSPIKLCFAYCAVFPKDHRFERDEVVRMWMAQGYIEPGTTRRMEDVGGRYFEDLLQISFFQEIEDEEEESSSYFVMHDLIHDLALSISNGECGKVVDGNLSSDGARHLLFGALEDIIAFMSRRPGDSLNKLRTCYFTPYQFIGIHDVALHLDEMCGRMKYLRVLNISCKLPDSVGNLKHLRYLCIDGYSLSRLPETLGNLLNLQTLFLQGSSHLTEFPKKITDLVNLRHLEFSNKLNKLLGMPRGIGRLTQLRTLPQFVVGDQEGSAGDHAGIEELSSMNHLQGDLEIVVKSLNKKWQVVEGSGDICKKEACILKNKQGLQSLSLSFGYEIKWSDYGASAAAESLLESLQPHTNIKQLKIDCYGGASLPTWIGHPSYRRLEKIDLANCDKCQLHLPELGQLVSLRSLSVTGMGVSCELLEAEPFPSLRYLELRQCVVGISLSFGTEAGGGISFPRLQRLFIVDCHRLEYVKLRHLTALEGLYIDSCEELLGLDYCGLIHIPSVRSMRLNECPKLNFQKTQQQQQLVPPSLRMLDICGCPLLSEWATTHNDQLEGVTYLGMQTDEVSQLHSFRNIQEFDVLKQVRNLIRHTYYLIGKTELRWDDVDQEGSSSGPADAEQILQQLRSIYDTRELMIQGYRGERFCPGISPALTFVKKITLSSCVHLDRLPPLGGLPFLQHLLIFRMPKITHVGLDFYDCGGRGDAFKSLQSLEFHDMPQWKEWGDIEDGAFPAIQVLKIYNCPKLRILNLPLRLLSKLESDIFHFMSETLEQEPLLPLLSKLESDNLRWQTVAPQQEPDTAIDLQLRL